MSPIEILNRIAGKVILVLGDAIEDHYIFGRVERICPEAPVPIFIPEREETRPGGAANVAAQLRALGAEVREGFGETRSVKRRYVAGQQIVLRVDRDVEGRPGLFDFRPTGFSAIVMSDYDKGFLTPQLCQYAISMGKVHKIPTIADPKKELFKFSGCSLLCPTESEFSNTPADRKKFPNILLKRGDKGMRLFEDVCMTEIPATARHVYDVTGAGDTVVAVVAAAVAAGASYLEAARLAALAAGFVVGEVGTTVCPLEKLKELVNAR